MSVAEATSVSGSASADTSVTQQSKAEDSLFTLLNLHPRDKNDWERLEKDRITIWAKLEILMDLHPSAFCRKYKFKTWKYEFHPLGMLCALKAPEDLIKTAYKIFPEAANDAFSMACAYDTDLKVIKWLYNKAPEAVKWKDPLDHLPLHVVMTRESSCLRTVKFILQSYPAALMCMNEDGCTPLHLAFYYSSLAIVKFLMGKSKADAVQTEDDFERTPLHCAFLDNKHEEVPEFVATKYPDFLKKPRSSDDRLPLHCACANATSIVGVKVLLEHYPDAAKQKDKRAKIPLALACKNKNFQGEELIELLVRVYPEAVDVEDDKGKKAIDLDLETYRRLVKRMAKGMGKPPAKKQRT
jgi:ankyrin repeat protein